MDRCFHSGWITGPCLSERDLDRESGTHRRFHGKRDLRNRLKDRALASVLVPDYHELHGTGSKFVCRLRHALVLYTYLWQLDLFIESKCVEVIDKSYLVGTLLANKMSDPPAHGGNGVVC